MQLFILPTNTCFGIACPINDIDGYKAIYTIKNRSLSKALAIMVDSFDWLELNTNLNKEQISFLKNYNRPFTILCNIKTMILGDNIPNLELYSKFAIRIAHNFMHLKLIRIYNSPLFLSSANRSSKPEIFSSYDIRKEFEYEIEKYKIKVFAHPEFCIQYKQKYSDLFEFIDNSLDINYLRKYNK